MAGEDEKPTHTEILDFTPEQWERHRWLAEREARERELLIKEREDRRSFFTNPLLLSIVGAIIAFMVNAANDTWSKSRNIAQAQREAESAMIQKAMDQDDPAKVIAKLRLLDAAGMIPRHRDQLRTLWTDDKAAALVLSAIPGTNAGRSDDSAAPATPAGAAAAPAAPAAPPAPCDKATPTGQVGWLYLGRAGKTEWVPAERGSDLIRWEVPPQTGAGFLDKAKGACLSVVQPKFLRDDGPAGQKRHSPIKMPVTSQMRMRVTDLDTGDPANPEPYEPIWAHVEILAN